ncbi:DUF3000 domain-containing protein [Arsenicicoccus sp. oral taxon 190]|uniref:DUF3000 domain-containing protein n=1 Tax=Arsenicicoccus sp. oral taxon 190 TaxID=1658671 RepID=UPI00067A2DB8|nr:DUF3000 domain-containing protein [Arsenicicoccus sp. oral taxon 190]AKT51990.1 enoyl-CoA hydratase [Arsenicicoccus sp. oral taxon 190]
MADRRLTDDSARRFEAALAGLRAVRLRPEVLLEEVPAPGRLAPFSVALAADVVPDRQEDDEVASGRFVVLFDPSAPEQWDGQWRVVTYARAALEAELAGDPALGGVGWSWLEDALRDVGAEAGALGGTVTRIVSEKFAGLADDPTTVEMELRASWSPLDDDLARHLQAWARLLCTLGGLPPLPDGVSFLSTRR